MEIEEMSKEAELIHKIAIFQAWLNLQYEACKTYGEEEEIGVWEKVIDKVNNTF